MNDVQHAKDHTENSVFARGRYAWRRKVSQMAILAMCSVLLMPGSVSAKKPVSKKPVDSGVGGVIFPPAYIDSGQDFTLKIVRDPAYTGVWSQPMVDAEAVFPATGGGKVITTYSETATRGKTYYYRVLAFNDTTQSDWSNTAIVTTP